MRYVSSFFCVVFCFCCLFISVSASGVSGDFAAPVEDVPVSYPEEVVFSLDSLLPLVPFDSNVDSGSTLEPMAILPDTSSGLSGGFYFVCDCALGDGVKFYVPADFACDSLSLDSDGALVNMTNSSIYLMPEASSLHDYTIYAPRFGLFQYRLTSYDYADLRIRNITDTNISFMDNTPLALSESTGFRIFVYVMCLSFLLLLFGKR